MLAATVEVQLQDTSRSLQSTKKGKRKVKLSTNNRVIAWPVEKARHLDCPAEAVATPWFGLPVVDLDTDVRFPGMYVALSVIPRPV